MGSACLFFVFFLGCGYSTSTGTQLRVLAPYICMGSSHACAIVQVAVSGPLNPTVRNYTPHSTPFCDFLLPVL